MQMAKFIFVSQITGRSGAVAAVTEEDDLGNVVVITPGQPGTEVTTRLAVNIDNVRSFKKRNPQRLPGGETRERVGTRIYFMNGAPRPGFGNRGTDRSVDRGGITDRD
jgi:hypothetical protein